MLRCTRWRRVDSGWKVGAALGSHRKCVPWFQLRLAAHASPSGHVAVIARCWRLPQSHSPEGGTLRCQITPGEPTPTTSGRMWMYLCLERAASHRCNVGGGGSLLWSGCTRASKRASSRRGYQSPPSVPRLTTSTIGDVPQDNTLSTETHSSIAVVNGASISFGTPTQ